MIVDSRPILLLPPSIINLTFKVKIFSLMAKSLAPVGIVFCLISIVTGSLWGKPTWGTWWVWDARLTSMLVLLFFYLIYLIVWKLVKNFDKANKISSIIVLKPLAPVFLCMANFAIVCKASGRNSSSHFSIAKSFWYCLVNAFLGSIRILTRALWFNSLRDATTGILPTNSGIRPYWIRSSGSISRKISPILLVSDMALTSAIKPMPEK